MKARILSLVSGLLLALVAQSAMAQPSAVVQNVTNVPATATSVNVNVTFTPAAGNTNAAQFDINFNKAELSADHASVCPSLWTCTQVAGGIRFVSPFSPGGGLAGFNVNVPFDLTSAMSNFTYPLTLDGELYADVNNQPLPANGSSNGSIQILAPVPDADFIPNAGLLDLGSAPQSTTASTTVTIDNVGPSGSLLDASCGITANSTVFSVSNGTVNDLGAADTPHEVTVNCSSPTIQTHNGTMVCTHNGDGTTNNGESPPQTLTYPLTCVMTAGPTPQYSSSPIAAGGTFNFGNPVKDTADPQISTGISNSGDNDTTLDSAGCTITTNPNNAYAIDAGAGAFSLATTDPARTITVSCDTAIAGNHNGGVLSCPHNGSNIGSPATYTLNCQVDPVPTYGAVLTPISPASIPQNNTPNPSGKLTITNSGDAGSNLSGTCSLNANTGALQFGVGGGAYTINKPGAPSTSQEINLVCNSAAQPGNHSATLSCTHNDPNGSSPEEYGVSCLVGQPDPAVYVSFPVPDSTIDITNGTPIPEGNTDPTAVLEVKNDAQAGDANMLLTCGPVQDVFGSAISTDADPTNQLVPPQGIVGITFSCDTVAASETPYEATYSCEWQSEFVPEFDSEAGPEAPQGRPSENYTVTCEVREGLSVVTPSPADGTPQVAIVQPGGMKSFFFTFSETGGEETDAELTSCSLEDGTNFEIVSPDPDTGFPAVIPAGGSVIVEVKGTDPGGVDSFGDELTCIYKDTDNPEGQGVTYPLTLNVGGDAYFTVLKDFTDDNPGEVTVDIDCDTGLILDQEKTITEDGIGVTFVVSSFDTGELNCNVTERAVAGYSTDYESSGDSATTDSDDGKDGCFYTAVNGGDNNLCVVTNDPDDVPVVINKEWLYPGSATGTSVSNYFEIVLVCLYGEIDGGFNLGQSDLDSPSGIAPQDCGPQAVTSVEGAQLISLDHFWCKGLSGNGNSTFTEHVKPYNYQTGALCVALETVFDDAIEVDNGCLPVMAISVGKGASCTITNTVFFEGIPTLSQYGMALLALLMLGMGFVAVRRIT